MWRAIERKRLKAVMEELKQRRYNMTKTETVQYD